MAVLISFGSGKGGVGKSVSAVNTALMLAARGKTVILVDADFGGANAHTLLGLRNSKDGLGTYLMSTAQDLASLVVSTEYSHLYFIHGDGLIPGTANMPFFRKQKFLRELKSLKADYILLDLGAGTSYNIIDLYLAADYGLLVSTPEPTAILNAYSFIKSAVYRQLFLHLPARSEARENLTRFFTSGLELQEEKSDSSARFQDFVHSLHEQIKDAPALKTISPSILINMAHDVQEAKLGARLRQICRKNLGTELSYLGFLPWSMDVRSSVVNRHPIFLDQPNSEYCKALNPLIEDLLKNSFDTKNSAFYEGFEDLEQLAQNFLDL